MDIRINTNLIKHLPLFKENKPGFDERFDEYVRYHSPQDSFTIPIENFSVEELNILQKAASKIEDTKHKALVRKIELFHKINRDPTGAKVSKLEHLPDAVRAAGNKLPNHWIFSEEPDGTFAPYYILESEFHPQSKYQPTHVDVSLNYVANEKVQSHAMTFFFADVVGGKTVKELFEGKGYYFETPKLVETYWKEIERYKAIHNLTGAQFNAVGRATVQDSSWSSGAIAMERDGLPTKVVMDDEDEESSSRGRKNRHSDDEEGDPLAVSLRFWKGKSNSDYGEHEDEEESAIPPLHPYVRVFDLTKHQYVEIHVNWLTEYKYNKGLAEKLILPTSTKSLINILIEGSKLVLDDIIKGKTGGIIVLATGEPGTGKTLTAEVYSESVQRPLYTVQCSQLGTDAEELEEKLTKTLARAVRWNAILLIDEADVYVHERGDSIEQNAIVGVFLRVLEYYRGILFLTSNRATIIDDAVLSRLTAHVRYEIPTPADATKIWEVLAEQYKIKPKDSLAELSKAFPGVSGRTIKNLLKLSKLLADREKKQVSVALAKYASQFLDGVKEEKKP